jgi:hypothetical protein
MLAPVQWPDPARCYRDAFFFCFLGRAARARAAVERTSGTSRSPPASGARVGRGPPTPRSDLDVLLVVGASGLTLRCRMPMPPEVNS